jgi:apolipoprotein N-acyltransferase
MRERRVVGREHVELRAVALETRQWVVQAALSGISASIAPDGAISHTTRLFDSTAFITKVRVRPAHSLYARTGDLFIFIFAIATLAALAQTAILKR